MFKSLKEKLKGWVNKAEGEQEELDESIEESLELNKITKKIKKVKDQKNNKKKEDKTEKNKITEDNEENIIIDNDVLERNDVKVKKKGILKKTLSNEKFNDLFDSLEMILLQNNIAYEAIESIRNSLSSRLVGKSKKVNIEEQLQLAIEEILIDAPDLIQQIKNKTNKPFVILFTGINGAGKTTTIAKIASLLQNNKLTVCFAAGDTFRAASIEQLQVHADRLKVPLIKKDYGSDPASVGFDAIKYAEKNKIDVVLIDTAGRMNNRDTLMKEIEKIARVNKPDLKIFLGESITGNDATRQAKDFNDAIEIDGIILSKADVDKKGGTAISVAKVTGKPIYYLGTGQEYKDLEKFNKKVLIEKIFE